MYSPYEGSLRVSFLIRYPGKILLKELDDSYAIKNIACLSIYILITYPKEEEPEMFYLDDTWVDGPLWEVIEARQASMEKDPGAPDA